MRLLLVGAFAYPHDQGSQVYFQEQALALRAAGAEVEVLSYGPGRAGAPAHPLANLPCHSLPAWAAPASRRSGPQAAKPFADLCLAVALRRLVANRRDPFGSTSSARGAPENATGAASKIASKRASPTATTRASMASSCCEPAMESPGVSVARAAEGRFDAILAHHAEAALLALQALPRSRPPVVYCAHTLLEHELPEYFKPLYENDFLIPTKRSEASGTCARATPRRAGGDGSAAPTRLAPDRPGLGLTQSLMTRLGRVIDRRIAAQADGWIALTQSTSRVMSTAGNAPGRLIAPPLPASDDAERLRPSSEAARERARRERADVARSHGLLPGEYFLYAGNLDPYQDLSLLEAVARARSGVSEQSGQRAGRSDPAQSIGRIPGGAPATRPMPIVIATHDERAAAFAARNSEARRAGGGLVVCRVRSASEATALLAGARATIIPRRSLGGFPIKLANSLAAGIPVVALHAAEWGLTDGRDALIGDLADPVASIARALVRLELEPALAMRLGQGARATHRRQHDPARVAAETLALLAALPKRRA